MDQAGVYPSLIICPSSASLYLKDDHVKNKILLEITESGVEKLTATDYLSTLCPSRTIHTDFSPLDIAAPSI